jgi:hypothetical protein
MREELAEGAVEAQFVLVVCDHGSKELGCLAHGHGVYE